MTIDNLTDVMDKLSVADQKMICFALNLSRKENEVKIHRGTLPFLNAKQVIARLKESKYTTIIDLADYIRKYKKYPLSGNVTFQMYLEDSKVVKRFGTRPEIGRPIFAAMPVKVTAGLKWSLPYKDYVPDTDARVMHHITLKCIGKNVWEISCHESQRECVVSWLMKTCSPVF